MGTIGIIAGNGALPLVAAQAARREGNDVYVCAIAGETDPTIEQYATRMTWIKLGELKKMASFFIEFDVHRIYFEGKITKTSLFSGKVWPDLDMLFLIGHLKNRNDDTILGALCDYCEKKGLHVLDSTELLHDLLPGQGVMTKKKPTRSEQDDITYGWALAKESARLDIGQSVVVKNKTVLAVEAIEGTDEAIRRGGSLGKEGVVVVKVAKPNQDMRFDVPTIGPETMRSMIAAHARVLAFEAGKTIVLDQPEVVRLANEVGITIVGV